MVMTLLKQLILISFIIQIQKKFILKYEHKLEPVPDFEYDNELVSKLLEIVEKQPDNYQAYFGCFIFRILNNSTSFFVFWIIAR